MDAIMKTTLRLTASTAFLLLIISLRTALAQQVPVATPRGTPTPPVVLGPDGNPLPAAPAPPWIDGDWADPPITLTNVNYEGLPLSEIASELRDQCKGYFDVLLPASPSGGLDPSSISVKLRLKEVTAREVFNAMNLLFENDRTPVRWRLTMNGKRPIALLRVLPEELAVVAQMAPEPKRMVYFVGDLVGDKKSGGMTVEQVVDTISKICNMSYGGQVPEVKFHKRHSWSLPPAHLNR